MCYWRDVAEDIVVLSNPEDSGFSAYGNLWWMSSFMFQSLHPDPSIRGIKERDRHWSATFLNPLQGESCRAHPALAVEGQDKKSGEHAAEEPINFLSGVCRYRIQSYVAWSPGQS